jgi:hypothetical protein
MRVRDHITPSTVGGAPLCQWLGKDIAGLWAGGALIDADRYVWLCVGHPRVGIAAHIALDLGYDVPMNRARAASLERDVFLCRERGTRSGPMDAHLQRQPWLLPSYRAQNLISLCAPYHDAAHAG